MYYWGMCTALQKDAGCASLGWQAVEHKIPRGKEELIPSGFKKHSEQKHNT